ncbi:hypothetical protein VOLCADRAFT_95549 [Volvox carteri f. nagariensis]|uniref:Uncharacterized protein n=1 Tax=Volvox carteri f. nagariensis TaxID=3068 RepID=D8U7S1_VOLCA|nr:uncharacterized protein VOLCADRAFT_95549 [Volvox carteri f. nagariensis]EFJ44283.1 hypothetical protein VOLCADRAFT_95549 [Volvox carteri f. nagariensis]|eukprot:XP_002954642.1 hypothetical protein VOLCADRAFT_95549 [Volvox carteri f. nagariensis]
MTTMESWSHWIYTQLRRRKTSCHFFNTGAEVDGKLPLAINWHYNTEYQQLVVLLSLQDVSIITNIMETDDLNIMLGMDLTGKLCTVYMSNPPVSQTCSPLPQWTDHVHAHVVVPG